jgi:regulator of protease activity HflC (stomatin/prohibitin superfamily)
MSDDRDREARYQYQRFQQDPSSVSPTWRAHFEQLLANYNSPSTQPKAKMNKPSPKLIVGTIVGLTAAAAVVFGVTWAAFMHTETVEPGHHGVIVDKPYFWGNEGVRKDPLTEGRLLMWRTSDMRPVRMTPQSIPVKVDDYSSSDNILLDFESTIQFRVTDSVRLVNEFGEGWFDNNIKQQYLAIVRDAIKKRTMTAMMSDTKTAADVDLEVTTALTALIKEAKLPILLLGVSMGRAKPNEAVLLQMNETAAQQQRQKTLVAATAAEVDRKKEQVAKAEADNAYRNAMGLSPDMFIQLEQIKRYAAACEKAGNVCVIGSSSNPVMVNAHK